MEDTLLLKVNTQEIDYVSSFVFDNGDEGKLGFDFTGCGVDNYEKQAYIELEDSTIIKYILGTGVTVRIPVRTEFTRSEVIKITPVAEKIVMGKKETHTFGLFTVDQQQVIGALVDLDPRDVEVITQIIATLNGVEERLTILEEKVNTLMEGIE